jgi:hypothetical protein
MKTNDRKIMAFAAPAELASAVQAAAAKEMCTSSYICRRALINDLRERGLFPEEEAHR